MQYRCISWNVNGLRAIYTKGLQQYIERESPDVLCFQEIKAEREQVPLDLQSPREYDAHYHSCSARKGYSGVATFTRKASHAPLGVERRIGEERFDREGRILRVDFQEFTLVNVYFPNGSLEEKGRLEYKLEFYDALFSHLERLRADGKRIVVCGDFNTAHDERDLARPKANEQTSGFMPIERAKLDEIVRLGYVDSFRAFVQEGGHYSWWSYRQGARQRNVGWRLDYFFLTGDLLPHLKEAFIHSDVGGSDHCPVGITLEF
jgi:exodeoxyribonuclease-3